MAKPKTNVKVAITADAKQFAKELKQAEKDVSGFEKAGSKAFGALKTAGVGLAIGIGAAFVKAALDFEKMEGILIKGTGATGEALADLKDQTLDVLKRVPESANVVAGAIADVNTHLGLTGDELEQTSKLFLDFARVAEVDVGDAIGQVDAQLTQFGLGAADTEEVLGDLIRISQATGVPMNKLLKQMETFGPIFANAGFSVEETTAIFGQLEQAGVDMTRVGPALNKFFRNAAAAGEDPQEALLGLTDAILNASSEAEALNIATEAFGAEGAQRMVSAIKSGNLDLREFGGLMGEGVGVVEQQADATATLSDKFNILKNKVLVGLAPLAIKVMDGIMVAMDALLPVVDAVIASVSDFFRSQGFANFMATVGGIVSSLIKGVKELWKTYELYVGFIVDLFSGDFAGAWAKLKEAVTRVVTWIEDKFGDVPGLIWEAIKKGLWMLLQAGLDIGHTLIDGIWDGLTAIGGAISDLAGTLADAFVSAVKWALNTLVIDPLNSAVRIGVDTLDFALGPWINFDDPGTLIPRLADGGIVTSPTLALIGEAGPEAVVPLDRAGGIGTTYVTVNVTGVSGAEVVKALESQGYLQAAPALSFDANRRNLLG